MNYPDSQFPGGRVVDFIPNLIFEMQCNLGIGVGSFCKIKLKLRTCTRIIILNGLNERGGLSFCFKMGKMQLLLFTVSWLYFLLGRSCRYRKKWPLELQTKVHPKVRNHGEGLYQGLLNVKLGCRCNYHKGCAAIRHYANQPAHPFSRLG